MFACCICYDGVYECLDAPQNRKNRSHLINLDRSFTKMIDIDGCTGRESLRHLEGKPMDSEVFFHVGEENLI